MAPSSRRRRRPADAAENAEEGMLRPSNGHTSDRSSSPSRSKSSEQQHLRRRRRHRSRRRRRDIDDGDGGEDESFCALVLKIGLVLLIAGSVIRTVVLVYWVDRQEAGTEGGGRNEDVPTGETDDAPPFVLPSFAVEDEPDVAKARLRRDSDAFGIAESLLGDDGDAAMAGLWPRSARDGVEGQVARFAEAARAAREEFAARYGGEDAARWILRRAISTFDAGGRWNATPAEDDGSIGTDGFLNAGSSDDLWHGIMDSVRVMAVRILSARSAGRPLKVAFGGYSVTAGRGNQFKQSYPFVLERILSGPLQLLGVDLVVRNSAIGGVPSFPYGWCLPNFLGGDADIVSWDYAMNEAGDVTGGIEAYIRRVLSLENKPMLVVKDTHMALRRRDGLQRYANLGLLPDSIVVHSDPAAEPFLSLPETNRPPGFQRWREFGSPMNAPGRAPHHPAVAEHEFLGWVLSMHILGAAEVAAVALRNGAAGNKSPHESLNIALTGKNNGLLPRPLLPDSVIEKMESSRDSISEEMVSLLYGRQHAQKVNSNHELWGMDPVHCRSSFDPILFGSLEELVVYGTAPSANNGKTLLENLMLPKGRGFYHKGWVLDLGESEKMAKRKLHRYGGLGFVDSKKAFYGIKASGGLGLFVPYEGSNHKTSDNGGLMVIGADSNAVPKEGDNATRWFQSIVVCEVNEKRDEGECNLERDLTFIVGRVQVETAKRIHAEGVSYLGKDICSILIIPSNARVETRGMMWERAQKAGVGLRSTKETGEKLEEVGLALEISVNNPSVDLKKGPCSISHVVWQEV